MSGTQTIATALPASATATSSPSDGREIAPQLESAFETIFTEVVYETPSGKWRINQAEAAKYGISTGEAEALVTLMESSPEDLRNGSKNSTSTRDAGSYARCIVSDAVGLPLSPDDAQAIGNLLKEKRWRDAAEKTIAVAALNGSAALLKFGFGAIGGPVGLAAKFAISAGACALGEKMPKTA